MMAHHSLNLEETLIAHTDDVVSLQDDYDGVYGDEVDVISESDQAVNQSTLRKLAQPHKLKINPNFEIWTNLDNLDNFCVFQ